MIEKEICGFLALGFGIIGNITYLMSIKKGKTKPHTITWFIWTTVMTVVFLGQIRAGAGAGAWITMMGLSFAFIFTVISLKRGETKITKFDFSCLLLALVAIILYLFSHHVIYSMLLATVIDVIGYLPTYHKSLKNPEEEETAPWIFFGICWILAIFATRNVNLVNLIYPISITIMNLIMITILFIKK